METSYTDLISDILEKLNHNDQSKPNLLTGDALYQSGAVQVLSQGKAFFEIAVEDRHDSFQLSFDLDEKLAGECSCNAEDWCSHRIAGVLQIQEILEARDSENILEGKSYTREGMIKRVIEERRSKALKAKYRIRYADNKYGEHTLVNEKNIAYKITFRDFEKQEGYCSCHDYATNKLGICKHLFFAFEDIKKRPGKLKARQGFPFVEVFLDPLNDYKISWYGIDTMEEELLTLIKKYFGNSHFVEDEGGMAMLQFVKAASKFRQVVIRPEVLRKIEKAFDLQLLQQKSMDASLDFSAIRAELFPYQQEGAVFATFRKGAIIADEMGLGKTLQAIAAAVFKKIHFGFQKTLVVCPASLKAQWKSEIEKFTFEKATIVEGHPDERKAIYEKDDAYFIIVNYETVLRDKQELNKLYPDLIILDEAQRIKNFETITANAIKSLKRNHSLVITGTPIENKLVDLYSIVGFADPDMLSPLWEFSYQHCYFDKEHNNKITGYYNLQQLKERLKDILIRREKSEVITQLNDLTMMDVSVSLHPMQAEYHADYAAAVAAILHKKFRTPFDMQRLSMNLQNMRMVCDSTYLVDKENHHSPKLTELEEILLQKLDLTNNERKIIIFSEWTTMLHIIGKMLAKNGIGFTELSGKVPVKSRNKLIREFENNPKCQVFLSTEAGGSGLNLQVADTVINFELPWNPAKKNQRIGRIDRLGQKNKKLTVINLISKNSIEMKIGAGLIMKQHLFDGVLNEDSTLDEVDFSQKGYAQFLQQLEEAMDEFLRVSEEDLPIEEMPEDAEDLTAGLFSEEEEEERMVMAAERAEQIRKLEEMETVMKKGMDFLAGLFKMSTGKDLNPEGNKIEVDKETGEIVMRFKL